MTEQAEPDPRHAARNDLDALLTPRAVAILGASDDPARIGGRPLRYMREAGFSGALYPINPKRETVQGLPAYADIESVPGEVDCAIVALPAPLVPAAVARCAARGVKSAVIFSSGFAEAGDEGESLQASLRETARRTGLRVVGPNCLGVFNAAAGFLATFSTSLDAGAPRPGGLAIVSQSGAYGSHLYALARAKGLGVTYWITTGNECDVELGECIGWLAGRDEAKVIVAYAEGARDGDALRRGLALARARRKPVVFIKVGRTEIGAEAAASHTAALAGRDAIYDAMFRQYGVHRADSTEEMLDIAYACLPGIFPAGRRIGLATISGGVGVQMADAAVERGLDVAPMPAEAQARLKAILPYAGPRNPVDITAQAFNDLGLVTRNFEIMLEDGGYDVVLAFFTVVAGSPYIAEPLLADLTGLRARFPDRPLVLSLLAAPEVVRRYEDAGYLVFEDPMRAVTAIAALTGFGRAFAETEVEEPPPSPLPAVAIPSRPLNEPDSKSLLAAAGLPMLPERVVDSAEAVAAAFAELGGGPVAMKLVSPDLAHKTEVGGVLLDVADADAAMAGFATLRERLRQAAPAARFDGVSMAPMAGEGVETILGVQNDPLFGPVVMLGLGGVLVELLDDVAFRLAPFGEREARAMIAQLRGRALLRGLRGRLPADEAALVQALVDLSRFATANADRLDSVDINPFLVRPAGEGAVALDALVVPRKTETET